MSGAGVLTLHACCVHQMPLDDAPLTQNVLRSLSSAALTPYRLSAQANVRPTRAAPEITTAGCAACSASHSGSGVNGSSSIWQPHLQKLQKLHNHGWLAGWLALAYQSFALRLWIDSFTFQLRLFTNFTMFSRGSAINTRANRYLFNSKYKLLNTKH